MAQSSAAVVSQVLRAVSQADQPVTARQVAAELNMHPTTTGDALRQLMKKNIVQRTVGQSTHGHPPYLYSASSDAVTWETPPVEAAAKPERTPRVRTKTTSRKKRTRTRARRNSLNKKVQLAVSMYSPSGRGFTVSDLRRKIGTCSNEGVRTHLDAMVAEGSVIKTDIIRDRSRVYMPAGATPPAPVVAPAAPPVPANLTGLEALVKERRELETELTNLRARIDEKSTRLAAVDSALDAARTLLA